MSCPKSQMATVSFLAEASKSPAVLNNISLLSSMKKNDEALIQALPDVEQL
jgi:hypothetical protein